MERHFSFTVEQTQTLIKGLPHEAGMGEQAKNLQYCFDKSQVKKLKQCKEISRL
jgi:hypothetical protein